MNKNKERQYKEEIENLNLKLRAISIEQENIVGWRIKSTGELIKDSKFALENPDLCEALVVSKQYDNLEWIPDFCDCNIDDKDNCVMCSCGMAGYWEDK